MPSEVSSPWRSFDELAALLDVGLAAAGGHARLGLHALHQDLEIARRQAQVEIELADVLVVVRIDGLVAGVEGLDDAGPTARVRDRVRVTIWIQSCLAAYSARIAGVSSVEPSSTMTQLDGRTVCAITLSSVWRM